MTQTERRIKQLWIVGLTSHEIAAEIGMNERMVQGILDDSANEPTPPDELIAQIAKDYLKIPSLDGQGRDRIDFYDLHVTCIKAALEAAWKAGKSSQ